MAELLYQIVTVNEMQFSFMSEIVIIDAVSILRLQKDGHARRKALYMFCRLGNNFGQVPRKAGHEEETMHQASVLSVYWQKRVC